MQLRVDMTAGKRSEHVHDDSDRNSACEAINIDFTACPVCTHSMLGQQSEKSADSAVALGCSLYLHLLCVISAADVEHTSYAQACL